MDINTFRGLLTLVLMLFFIVLCFMVFSKKSKKSYEEAARMALDAENVDLESEDGES